MSLDFIRLRSYEVSSVSFCFARKKTTLGQKPKIWRSSDIWFLRYASGVLVAAAGKVIMVNIFVEYALTIIAYLSYKHTVAKHCSQK